MLELDSYTVTLDFNNHVEKEISEEHNLTAGKECLPEQIIEKDTVAMPNTCSNCKNFFSIERFMYDMKAVHFYTGLENYEKFCFVYDTLGPAVDYLKYVYCKPPEHITPLNRFFITLIILRRRKTYYELSLFFGTTEKQISNIFITWIRFMHLQWKEVHEWPSRELVQFYSPADFKKKIPKTENYFRWHRNKN